MGPKILGGGAMFYYALVSVLRVVGNCYEDEEYTFPRCMSSMDGIAYHIFNARKGIEHQKYLKENQRLREAN